MQKPYFSNIVLLYFWSSAFLGIGSWTGIANHFDKIEEEAKATESVLVDDATTTNVIKQDFNSNCSISFDNISTICTQTGANSFTSDIIVQISWLEKPPGESILVSYDGVSLQLIPSTATSPQTVTFSGINSDGSIGDRIIQANFSTTNSCSFSTSFGCRELVPCVSDLGIPTSAICNNPSATAIEGTIWEDFNYDGVINESTLNGVAGVTVVAYDCAGNIAGTTFSDSNGKYQFTNLKAGDDYRIEFSLPTAISCDLSFSVLGEDNSSSVQFVQAGDCANLGLSSAEMICKEDEMLITSCYNFGGYQGAFRANDAIVGVLTNKIDNPTTDALTKVVHYATHEQVGTTYGVAVSETRKKIYSSAYMKRHTSFGPGGTGAIYEVDMNLIQSPFVMADLNSIYGAGTAGLDPHTYPESSTCPNSIGGSSNFACWFNDVDSWAKVGRTSLGDLDISDDEKYLFVMNLEDRSVYQIDIDNPGATQTTYPFPLNQLTDPNVINKPLDPAKDMRPFALKYKDGKIFVGAIDSELSRTACCAIGGSVIYVYALDLGTGTWELVLEQDIQRGAPSGTYEAILKWSDDFYDDYRDTKQMLVSDIEFDGDDIIVGTRDLSADRYGNQAGKPIAGDGNTVFYASSVGDLVRFAYNNSTNSFSFENNGTAGSITSGGANSGYGWPLNTTPRGSFYHGDYFNAYHSQTSLGGLWLNPNDNRIYSTVYNPLNVYSAGIKSFDNTTGSTRESYVLIKNSRVSGGFGKTGGLGDLESACPGVPIEISNRIWDDTNRDGIQDACEGPISGVILALYNNACQIVAIDTTDHNGLSIFNDSKVESYVAQPDLTLKSGTYNVVVIGSVGTGEWTISDHSLTVNNKNYIITNSFVGSNEFIDSDGEIATSSNNCGMILDYPFATVTVGVEDNVRTDIDFGFLTTEEVCDDGIDNDGDSLVDCDDDDCVVTSVGSIAGDEERCGAYNPTIITSTDPAVGYGMIQYQWQSSTDGIIWSDFASATLETFDPPTISQTTHYRRGARNEFCVTWKYSNQITKTVILNVTNGGQITGDESGCGTYDPDYITSNSDPSGGSSGVITYAWESRVPGGTWSTITGANSAAYDPPTIFQTMEYRRGARRAPCTNLVYSNTVTKVVISGMPASITSSPTGTLCSKTEYAFTAQNTGAGALHYWNFGAYASQSNATGVGPHQILFDVPKTSASTTIEVELIVGVEACDSRDTVEIEVLAGIDTTSIVTSDPTSCNAPDGSITISADYYTGNNIEVSLDGGSTWETQNQLTFNDLTSGFYDIQIRYAGQTCVYDFGRVTLSDIVVVNSGIIYNDDDFYMCPDSVTNLARGLTATQSSNFRNDRFLANEATDGNTNDFTHTVNEPNAWWELDLGAIEDIDKIRIWNRSNCCPFRLSNFYVFLSDVPFTSDNFNTTLNQANVWSENIVDYPDLVTEVFPNRTGRYLRIQLAGTNPLSLAEVEVNPIDYAQTFSAITDPSITSYTWDFGADAVPATATGAGPHQVRYLKPGNKTAVLTTSQNGCNSVYSESFEFIQNVIDAGEIAEDQFLCGINDPDPLTNISNATGGIGGTITYQWQQRIKATPFIWGNWGNIPGETALSYDPPVLTEETQYRRMASRTSCEGIPTNVVSVTPSAIPDANITSFVSVCPGQAFSEDVSTNDNNILNPSYSVYTPAQNGSVSIFDDGSFIYEPNSAFCGTDRFVYEVCNHGGTCCDTATVNLDLTDPAAPVLFDIPQPEFLHCDEDVPTPPFVLALENCLQVELGMDEVSTQGLSNCELHTYNITRVWTATDYCGLSASDSQTITVEDVNAPGIYRIYTLDNGTKMIGGFIDNVGERWKHVTLPITFATNPIIFTQVVSENDASAASVQLKNVSKSQFDIRLMDEEAKDYVAHGRERVAWIAMEPGSGSMNNSFEVSSLPVDSNPKIINFSQSFTSSPVFIANTQTAYSSEPVEVRVPNLNSSNASLYLQEDKSADLETTHSIEGVGYVAFDKKADLELPSGEIFGETGKASFPGDVWKLVTLSHTYKNPIVIATISTENDSEAVGVRIKDVTPTEFYMKIDGWDYQTNTHGTEEISYMVIEGSIPFDQTVACDNIPAPLQIGTEIVTVDNCDVAVNIEYSETPNTNNCAPGNIITRSWYAEDECGNSISYSREISVFDNVDPEFTVPADVTIECEDDINDLTLTGDVEDESDNCAVGIEATYVDLYTGAFECDSSFTVVREWTLHDNCGNSISKNQNISVVHRGVKIATRMMLQGALFDTNDGLMRDDLRILGLIPTEEPYTEIPTYQQIGGGGESVDPAVFGAVGQDAIVDWVFIEIRNSVHHDSIIATRSALLQRDGDVVDVDGVSPVNFDNVQPGQYNFSIRHRNHLGAVTLYPKRLKNEPQVAPFDFSETVTVDPMDVMGAFDFDGDSLVYLCHDTGTSKNTILESLDNIDAYTDQSTITTCGPCGTYKTIKDGKWDEPSTWENGSVPPVAFSGKEVVVNHAVEVSDYLEVGTDALLWIEKGALLVTNHFKILDNGIVYALDSDITLGDQMYIGSSPALNPKFVMYGGQFNIGRDYQNNGGHVFLRNVCVKAETGYQNIGGYEKYEDVQVELLTGDFRIFATNATLRAGKSRFKLHKGGFINDGQFKGGRNILWMLDGGIQSYGSWESGIEYYCMSDSITNLVNGELPPTQDCANMFNHFSGFICGDVVDQLMVENIISNPEMPQIGTWGTHAQKITPYGNALWAGDYNSDRKTIYQGPANDISSLFVKVITDPDNVNALPNYIRKAYDTADIDLNGDVIYQGPNNERAKLLFNSVLVSPGNVQFLPNFIITEQIPR